MDKILDELSLNYTAIGSLPFKGQGAAVDAVTYTFRHFKDIPFWAQLPHFTKEEDMVLQYTQNMPGFKSDDKSENYYFDDTDEDFFIKLEDLFIDYETILSSDNLCDYEEILDKYKISKPYSNTIELFLNNLEKFPSKFVKGSITGPFTFSTSINDKSTKCAYYNETLREIIVKTLSLKALWQIKEFNKHKKNAVPIIFMDEPSISQVGSCAFVTVKNDDVIQMLKLISDNIKKYGALSGIHCCGKTDWNIAISSNVNIINFDAYFYSKAISTFATEVSEFLDNKGILSFGIVPTADKEILEKLNVEILEKKFEESISCLTQKNINKNTILKQCFITPSCGCGSLDEKYAIKALELTKELSCLLKEKYKVKI